VQHRRIVFDHLLNIFTLLLYQDTKNSASPSKNSLKFGIDQRPTDVYNLALIMKKELHPKNYRLVVFKDLNNGTQFLTKSTVASDETVKWEDGNEYPLVSVHISSASHPFFTGQEKMIDIEGRVDRFKARQEAAAKRKEATMSKAKKVRVRKTADTVEESK
jgi:large subunit ribosomal protein L31